MGSELFGQPIIPLNTAANTRNNYYPASSPSIYSSPQRGSGYPQFSVGGQYSPSSGHLTSTTGHDKTSPAVFGSSASNTTYPPGLLVDGSAADAASTDHEGRSNPSRSRNNWPEMSDTLQKITGLAVGFGTVITDCVISHPCAVIRYQCQINGNGRMRHLQPFTLMSFCYNLVRHQGAGVLWKGLTSTFVTRGVCFAVETALSDFFNLPREVSRVSSAKKVSQHLLLKAIAFGVATPFFATNFVEIVQSAIATDQSSLVDYFRDTVCRLSGRGHLSTAGTRLIPVYVLVVPTVCFHVAHYCIATLARVTTLSLQRHSYNTDATARSMSAGDRMSVGGGSAIDQSGYDSDDHNSIASSEPSGVTLIQPDPARELRIQQQRCLAELLAIFTGNLMADLALYPVQTILHRLYIQGTRTIVDSTDNGLEVLAVTTRYSGFFDCAHHIYRDEGLGGFFRGFGALVLQYSLQALILRMAAAAFDAIAPPPRCSDMASNRRRSRRYR